MNNGKTKFESSVTNKCKLLCSDCGDVMRRVADVQYDTHSDTVVILRECGHKRGELLPLKEGHISIEHVILNDTLARQMFPIVKEAA